MADATTTDLTTSASAIVNASAAEVFDFIRRPANHPTISGDDSVKDATSGPDVLDMGTKFGMSMVMGLPYRVSSKVVEFEQDRKIAWAHLGRHRWRWEFEAQDDGTTLVTETFDMSPSPIKPLLRMAMSLPEGHAENVARSVENVAAHFA